MSGGIDSIQTSNGLGTALLASLWARQLPYLLIWQKKTQLKKEQRNLMSCKICPNSDLAILSTLIELIITFESPSTIKQWKLNSFANQRARRIASTSTIFTEAGSEICCVKATVTSPCSLQIIIPSPAVFSSAKSAPLKFTLSRPADEERHLMDLAIHGIFSWVGRRWWYS